MSVVEHCPTCGTRVRGVSGEEGTGHLAPEVTGEMAEKAIEIWRTALEVPGRARMILAIQQALELGRHA